MLPYGRLQGGVKLPTGGKFIIGRARERLRFRKVSRSGAKPGPTVIVRMREDVDTRASSKKLVLAAGVYVCPETFSPLFFLRGAFHVCSVTSPHFSFSYGRQSAH